MKAAAFAIAVIAFAWAFAPNSDPPEIYFCGMVTGAALGFIFGIVLGNKG